MAKMAVESIFSRGKCLGFAAKWFTFPGKNRLGMSIPDTDK